MAQNPGLVALNGFAYQIKVYVSLLPKMTYSEILGYELDDDVSSFEFDSFKAKIDGTDVLYQVKKANVDADIAKKVLYNWLLAEDAQKYVLIVQNGYKCKEDYFISPDIDDLYNELSDKNENDKKKKKTSLEVKVFDKYKASNKKTEFEKKCNLIKNNYQRVNPNYDVDTELFNNCKDVFHYNCKHEDNYILRLNKLMKEFDYLIVEKKEYKKSKEQFNVIVEQIVIDTPEEQYIPVKTFSDFKSEFNLTDELKQSREYRQLMYCSLSEDKVKKYLSEKTYYEDIRTYYLSRANLMKVRNWEEEAFDNYDELKDKYKDSPPV